MSMQLIHLNTEAGGGGWGGGITHGNKGNG